MEIETIQENTNDLLNRKELRLKIFSEGSTPKKEAVYTEIAKKYKTKEAHIDIRTIQQQDGAQFSICSINIYKKPIREEKKKEGEKDTKTEDTGENKPAEDTKEKTEENKPDKKQDNKEQEEKTEETKDGE